MLIFKHIVNSCIVIKYFLCKPEYQVSQPCGCECRNLFSMYALLSKKLVEESKRYQYLKTEVKQSNANGILPKSWTPLLALEISLRALWVLQGSHALFLNLFILFNVMCL